jgi:hypothetical protein
MNYRCCSSKFEHCVQFDSLEEAVSFLVNYPGGYIQKRIAGGWLEVTNVQLG